MNAVYLSVDLERRCTVHINGKDNRLWQDDRSVKSDNIRSV